MAKRVAKRKQAKKATSGKRAVKRAAPTSRRPKISWKPPGQQSAMANLTVSNCAAALEWWKEVFGVKETAPRAPAPDGKSIWHAEFLLDDTLVYANDRMDETPPGQAQMFVYVPDVDAVFARALAAGAKQTLPLTDMFWGDRSGQFVDPYGVSWSMATKTEWLTHAQIAERAEKFMAGLQGQSPGF